MEETRMQEAFKKMFEKDIAVEKDAGEEPKDWYFTFGYDHQTPEGSSLKNCYMVFNGTFSEARMQMFEVWGNQWSHQYFSSEAAGVERFNLTEYKANA
jgi:hypothetical protein